MTAGLGVYQAAKCKGSVSFGVRALTLDLASRQALTSESVADSKNSCVFHSAHPWASPRLANVNTLTATSRYFSFNVILHCPP